LKGSIPVPFEPEEIVMINKAILVGNLGRDPEIRSTVSGTPVANLSLATNRRWNDRDGNRQEATEWHRVVCFGRQAEIAGEYLTCGRLIYVEGRIQTRSWEDRETGETKYATEVVCERFQMLGQRGGGDAEPVAPATDDLGPEPEDDDIPF
jgi:single-strand DNA-binding protein